MATTTRTLIVGLGNLTHPLTRHSVGQLALDSLSARLGAHLSQNKSIGGYYAEISVDIHGRPFIIGLYKTNAPMNISGPPVSMALRKTARMPSSLVVIHDSLEHKPTVLSPKFGGSANGHNGIRSLISALGTKDFHRLRLGIGKPASDVADYVLTKLPNFERQFWGLDGQGLDLLWEQIKRTVLHIDQLPR
ncbi:peptidyl-tRNA hydrolase [Multifurca ochricompacta]|uniref:peptidyl-tRNA hydrolase n=1 Tax=Multifurca ochricompacta TaxID=376703 RepID=A0AAD4M9T3_9AGAM|nr:peptidyl-tRNA hydrolase [Multifurca ochricompacta]